METDLKKLIEQAVEKITELKTTVKEVKTTVKDASLKIDEASTQVTEASTKIDGVASGVTDIRKKLDEAGHVAVFWNLSSLLFGVAGVVLGIITLHS